MDSSVSTVLGSHPGGKLQQVLSDMKIAALTVSDNIKEKLMKVVTRWLNAFAARNRDLGRTLVITLTIKSLDAKPFRHKLRPIPFAKRQFMEKKLERLLMLVQSYAPNPVNAPMLLELYWCVKKDGSTKPCVDYRDLNAQTEKDSYHLPRIGEVSHSLAKAKNFAALDLLMGYHKVEVE